jgi:hypothetical protein
MLRTIDIEPGTDVYTMDGKRLGAVKEVREDAFKVDVRWGRDYWLDRNEVMELKDYCATLCIPADEVNMHKLSHGGTMMGGGSSGGYDVPGRDNYDFMR